MFFANLVNLNVSKIFVANISDNSTIENLYDKVRIICLLITRADDRRRQHTIYKTWGKRCNRLIKITGNTSIDVKKEEIINEKYPKFTQLVVNANDTSRMTLLYKVHAGIKYINRHYNQKLFIYTFCLK